MPSLLQHYVADKVYCVWLADGELTVLFESNKFVGPDHLGSAPMDLISNKELVQEYLDKMKYIPHTRRMVTLEPTAGLQTKN